MVQPHSDSAGIVTLSTSLTVSEAVTRLTEILQGKRLRLFAVVDHSGEAAKVGLTMPDTKLVIFGSPEAGTPVMLAAPLSALDLPLKILIWQHSDGGTRVSYTSPDYLARRHHLEGDDRARLEPIISIADATASAGP
jgi:uncharacterized protein (DUF302 family)